MVVRSNTGGDQEQGLSNEQMRLQVKSFINQIRAVATELDVKLERGLYMTTEDRVELSVYIQEYLGVPLVDFEHTLLADIKQFINWIAKKKQERGF